MLLLVLLLAMAPPAAGAAEWRWPLHGDVITPFHLRANPFAAGQHRGVDIAASAGQRVRSACAGRVTFAGEIPGRSHVVAVLCGPLVATYLELGGVVVKRGDAVAAGAPIGTVAASRLQLGARRVDERDGYVDPLTLLHERRPPPTALVPRRGPRGVAPRESPRPAPAGGPLTAPDATPAAAPVEAGGAASAAEPRSRVPGLAWLGLGLFVAGTPLGALARRRRRSRLDPALQHAS